MQAGGQRYVYEITKALSKEEYEISFLKVTPMNSDKNWSNEYYYQPTLNLNCEVYFLEDFFPKSNRKSKKRTFWVRGLRFFFKKFGVDNLLKRDREINLQHRNKKIDQFISQFDLVNFSGVSVYNYVSNIEKINVRNAYIHILSFGFQHKNMYDGYNKTQYYNFITPVTPDAAKKDLKGFINYDLTYFPLCFETEPYDILTREGRDVFEIAIFTRLSSMKPLDPFFYAFKLLLEKGIKAKLNIYGSGDPDALGLLKQLDYMYIRSNVIFHGHVESIENTLKDTIPDLIWYQSANKEPGGYAAMEIAMSGIPQTFWDFMDIGESRPIEKTFPSFTNISSFVEFNYALILSPPKRKELGIMQREYVLKHYSIKDHIHILEDIFT